MGMEFCEGCGKILEVKEIMGIKRGVCDCGFVGGVTDVFVSDEIEKPEEVGKGVASSENIFATFPHKCKKCGHGKCEIRELGAAYSDEANRYLFICAKCAHVERQADGSCNG